MAVGFGSLVDGDDMTITNTTWVVAEDASVDIEVTPAPNEFVHVSVEYNPATTPAESFEFQVQSTVAATSIEWDDTPVIAFAMPNTPDPNYRSFVIFGYYKIRFRGRQTGTETAAFKVAYRIGTMS